MPFIEARRRTLVEEVRNGLKEQPKTRTDSYLGAFAIVGALGGTVAALIWRWIERMHPF